MVNSSWTEGHITSLWRNQPTVLYPPCDTKVFESLPRRDGDQNGQFRILSLGQFRPEKDHALQLRALARLRDEILEGEKAEEKWQRVRLVLVGGVRNEEDRQRVESLRALAAHLAVEENVEFAVNLKFDQLKEEMSLAAAGLHTMLDEHFGIAVVEMLAAGLVTVAHRSGGPLLDIVVESPEHARNGFLAVNEEEYALALLAAMDMSAEQRSAIVARARDSVSRRFGESQFMSGWISAVETVAAAARMRA